MANGTKSAPNGPTYVLRISPDGSESQYAAKTDLNTALNNAVKKLPENPEEGLVATAEVELAAFILTNGDTYLVPVKPTSGQATKPEGATQIDGGLTIQRWSVNPKYCYVDMGNWGFYYLCGV